MKDIVNTKIKFREPYRPFAPSVIEERAADCSIFANRRGIIPPASCCWWHR